MELISVYKTSGNLEAEMVKGFLEAQGIQVVLNQESVARTIGLSVGRLGKVDVLVPDKQAAEAAELLAAMEAGEFENTTTNDQQQQQQQEEEEEEEED